MGAIGAIIPASVSAISRVVISVMPVRPLIACERPLTTTRTARYRSRSPPGTRPPRPSPPEACRRPPPSSPASSSRSSWCSSMLQSGDVVWGRVLHRGGRSPPAPGPARVGLPQVVDDAADGVADQEGAGGGGHDGQDAAVDL